MLRRLPTLLRRSGGAIARNLPKYHLYSSTAIPAFWASHCFNQQQQQVVASDILTNKDITNDDNIVYHSEVDPSFRRHPHEMKIATGVLPDEVDIPETVVVHNKPHSTYKLANDVMRDDKFDPDHVAKVYPLGDEELEKEEAMLAKAKEHRSPSDVVLEELSEVDEERMMKSSPISKDENEEEQPQQEKKKKTRATGPNIAHDIPELKVTKHVDPVMRKGRQGPIVAKDTM